ncbi:MAG: TfoX/Sxy family protein [Boseongicola sp.]|nr:TfoX/Sxy family protein [Boseongicola sp.]
MTAPVSSIRNLGPASDASFAKAGIATADQLRDIGADEAYAKLLLSGIRPHFIGYYALVMGLQGRPWNDCRGEEKAELRRRFDEIKSKTKQAAPSDGSLPANLEDVLNRIGVR